MKRLSLNFMVVLSAIFVCGVWSASAENSVKISEPADGAEVSSLVKVCMEVHGVEVEPAKKGVNKGKGHHHLLVDTDLPANLKKPIAKDANHIHMGDGSTCKELKLDAGGSMPSLDLQRQPRSLRSASGKYDFNHRKIIYSDSLELRNAVPQGAAFFLSTFMAGAWKQGIHWSPGGCRLGLALI